MSQDNTQFDKEKIEERNIGGEEEEVENSEKDSDTETLVFDRGYCWVICLACFLINFGTWGMNSGFAIYFSVYLNNDTFPGASKIDYAAIGGLAFGTTLIFTPLINYLQGVVGPRATIVIGNCFQFTSLMLASWSRHLWQLYLTQGLMQSAGLALISLPAMTILPQFFKKRRVLAGGLATAGSGAGGVVFNLGMQKIVEVKDVFWALRAQSIISFGLIWIAIILFRNRSEHHKIEFTFFDREVVSSIGFYLALIYVITCMFGYVVCLYTLANFTTSLGYSEYQASIASAMIQVGSCFGRPLIGLLADKYGATTLAFEAYALSAVFVLAMWIPARNYATVMVLAFILGGIMGTIWGTFAPLLARLVGIRKMNVSFSMLWAFLGVAGLVSPVIGVSLVKDIVGPTQYEYCALFAGVSFAVCALSLFLLRGFVLARDVKLDSGNTDHDLQESIAVNVSVGQMLKHSLRFRNVKV